MLLQCRVWNWKGSIIRALIPHSKLRTCHIENHGGRNEANHVSIFISDKSYRIWYVSLTCGGVGTENLCKSWTTMCTWVYKDDTQLASRFGHTNHQSCGTACQMMQFLFNQVEGMRQSNYVTWPEIRSQRVRCEAIWVLHLLPPKTDLGTSYP